MHEIIFKMYNTTSHMYIKWEVRAIYHQLYEHWQLLLFPYILTRIKTKDSKEIKILYSTQLILLVTFTQNSPALHSTLHTVKLCTNPRRKSFLNYLFTTHASNNLHSATIFPFKHRRTRIRKDHWDEPLHALNVAQRRAPLWEVNTNRQP
jgi:hypothetical protein